MKLNIGDYCYFHSGLGWILFKIVSKTARKFSYVRILIGGKKAMDTRIQEVAINSPFTDESSSINKWQVIKVIFEGSP